MNTDDFTMTIGGAAARASTTIDVINPATGKVFASAPNASQEDLESAVATADVAFGVWRKCPIAERQSFLVRIAEVLGSHIEPLARLLTREQGKPIIGATQELQQAIYWLKAHSHLDLPVTIRESGGRRIETHHTPLGVVCAIAPWNFPVNLSVWKIAPALLAGNTVVLKPSPFTPLTTLKIGELLRGVLPPGVLNVISGDDSLGPRMTVHPGFAKIAFTGSSATGKKVMASAAGTLKRLTLELGGNDAAIIFPDVDVDEIAPQIFAGAFHNTAQICVATKRLYIHEDVYAPLRDRLIEIASETVIGDGSEQGTVLGPIQNLPQYRRVRSLLDAAKASNLTVIECGKPPEGDGYFVPIAIVDDPPDDSAVVTEEAFGPILPMLKFRDVEDVVRRANATEYGLAGAVWSKDIDLAVQTAHQLETGSVWINDNLFLSPHAPFGGHKQSGLGLENGLEGLLAYTNSKTLYVRKPGQ
jgi:acyl-CoA reductase-like NAD-dependent aldehyde dehydrogenase